LLGTARKIKAEELKNKLLSRQKCFTKATSINEAATRASFRVAKEIASSSRPFTDGDFVKKCLQIVCEEMCPEKKLLFQDVSLSRMTIQRRIGDISENLTHQLKDICSKFEYFSIALDESCDVKDTAQLLVFIRGVSHTFEVTEELADMRSMHGHTTGEDICKEVITILKDLNLSEDKLSAMCSDGAASFTKSHCAARLSNLIMSCQLSLQQST